MSTEYVIRLKGMIHFCIVWCLLFEHWVFLFISNMSSKDRTWSAVPEALLDCIDRVKNRSESRAAALKGWCPVGLWIEFPDVLVGLIWGLEGLIPCMNGRFEAYRVDMKPYTRPGGQFWCLRGRFEVLWADLKTEVLICSLEGWFEAWRADFFWKGWFKGLEGKYQVWGCWFEALISK